MEELEEEKNSTLEAKNDAVYLYRFDFNLTKMGYKFQVDGKLS